MGVTHEYVVAFVLLLFDMSFLLRIAEAPSIQVPSGYDEEFVCKVEEDLECSICHQPLKEPVLTRCGHRFCKECIEEHFRRYNNYMHCRGHAARLN